MADKLQFSLVSPERELFSGSVDQVDVPGTEGDLGILPNHSPLMAAIRAGVITVTDGGATSQYFVAGGFADVTPDGLTILAERAMPLDDMDREALAGEIRDAEAALSGLTGDAQMAASQHLDGLKSVAGS